MKKIALLEDEKKYWEDLASTTKQISAKVTEEVDRIVTHAIQELKNVNELGEAEVDVAML